ncbi:MAG TPA: hypothetical protein VE866_01740 [Candidatus Binatia bacterium]|nr:hypothetical protein [Candidatus Binatia bacterium]
MPRPQASSFVSSSSIRRSRSVRSPILLRLTLFALATLAASGVALGVSVGPASACTAASGSNGFSWRNSSGDNGSRSYISGSSTLSSCGAAGAFVTIEGDPYSGLPMIQTGYIKETPTNTTDCGTGVISVITEYDNNGNYTCDVTAFSVPFGEGDSFTVEHHSNGWWTYLNGYAELANPITVLNFCCGYSIATAEAHWSGALPTFLSWWGPSGSLAWQYRTPTSGYSNVTSSNFGQNGGSYWYRSDQKSPFYIQWVG